jgi:pyridinium-3,5-biscarboxylic acid mononucleotide sulfurtransferase
VIYSYFNLITRIISISNNYAIARLPSLYTQVIGYYLTIYRDTVKDCYITNKIVVCAILLSVSDLNKLQTVKSDIITLGRVLVCFSGGVDSSFLLKVALDAVGKHNVIALIARSQTYPTYECDTAIQLAEEMGASYEIVESDEMSDESYLINSKERCYFCKRHLFDIARKIANRHGIDHVLEGSNVDDQNDYRPGRRAGEEAGIISPLFNAGLAKSEIRQLSKYLGLPTHTKPSMACLASRIPYGIRIDADILKRVEKSEEFLKRLGMSQLRVRYHGHVARIEVGEDDFNKVIENRNHIVETLQEMGFLYVTLDLKGYRTGSMNDVL